MKKIFPSVFGLGLLLALPTLAQSSNLVSEIDREMTIHSVAVLKMEDNLSGIYANPLGQELQDLVSHDQQWTLVSAGKERVSSVELLETKPDLVQALRLKTSADAIVAARLTKGPNGVLLVLDLFTTRSGLLLEQTKLVNYPGFDIPDLKEQLRKLYHSLRKKIPFDGWVLSRKGNLVTVNLGSNQGMKMDEELTAVLIIRAQRHPKFNFLVSTEREVLGKIKIKQVEDNLSFGSVIVEKEDGIIQVGNKVLSENWVEHPEAGMTADEKLIAGANNPVAFGEHPREWKPMAHPSLGKIGLLLGLTNYSLSNSLSTSGGASASDPLAPSILLDGELWINTNWFMDIEVHNWIFSVANPIAGTPGTLHVSSSQDTLLFGYNFLLRDEFSGPRFHVAGGFSTYSGHIDQSAPKTAFTSETFSGLLLRLGGALPIESQEHPAYTLGADLDLFLSPNMSESPVTSGSSNTSSVLSFSGFIEYPYTERILLKGRLSYDSYSASFSGVGSRSETASSSSHNLVGLLAGIEYLF